MQDGRQAGCHGALKSRRKVLRPLDRLPMATEGYRIGREVRIAQGGSRDAGGEFALSARAIGSP